MKKKHNFYHINFIISIQSYNDSVRLQQIDFDEHTFQFNAITSFH